MESLSPRSTELATELIVALDFPEPAPALKLVDELRGLPVIHKVGSELFLAGGPELVRAIGKTGARIFLDLKFHDIPNTVAKAVAQAARLGVEMLTCHLSLGPAAFAAAKRELEGFSGKKPRILGVSVLTSFDDASWGDVTEVLAGKRARVADSVSALVARAEDWGAGGVVCSAHELAALRKTHPALYAVVPGIRPEGSPSGDQARIMTPLEARKGRASAIVVGRPILQSPNPKKTVERSSRI